MPEFASVVPTRSIARSATADLLTSGYYYGPTFQGIEQLWRGEREMLAEIHVPSGLSEHLSDYRLHPGRS